MQWLANISTISESPLFVFLIIILSLALPLGIFFGQSTIGTRRLAIIGYLKNCSEDIDPALRAWMVRSLDFTGARYAPAQNPGLRGLAYLLPTGLFVILSAFGFLALFAAASMDAFEVRNFILFGLNDVKGDDFAGYQAGTALVVAAAFLGAYIWSINYLVLRVSNYDLNPLSFLRASAHLLLTIFVACVLRHTLAAMGDGFEVWTVGVVLGASFLMGFFPNMGIGLLIDRLPEGIRLKRPIQQASEISRDFPLDLIDGVTPTISFRLASFDITDVHNLAAADPVTLYLESPYGHLEILDWIGQAQLLACLGPERFLKCRKANIRDIHALLEVSHDSAGPQILKGLLFTDLEMTDDAVRLTINAIASTLHVQRLLRWKAAIMALMTLQTGEKKVFPLAAE